MKRFSFVAAVAAALSLPATPGTHDTPFRETVTIAADQPIPNVPGKRLVSVVVDYPPGAISLPHRHARSAFIYAYVLSGKIRSQVNDEPVRVYQSGEWWFGARFPVPHLSRARRPTIPSTFVGWTAMSDGVISARSD